MLRGDKLRDKSIDNAIKVLENKARQEYSDASSSGPLFAPKQKLSTEKSLFVEPALLVQKKSSKTTKSLKYENIFKPSKSTKAKPRTLLIIGNTGFGKSSISAKIVSDWSAKRNSFLADIRLAVLLKLKEIKNEESLPNILLNTFLETLRKESILHPNIISVLTPIQQQILVVLDGYDSLRSDRRNEVIDFLTKDTFFHSATILVTTTEDALDARLKNVFDKQITILVPTKEVREKVVSKYFGTNSDKAQKMNDFLEYHQLRFLARNSMEMLVVLCGLFDDQNQTRQWIRTDPEIIFQFTLTLLLRAYQTENNGKQLSEEKVTDILYRLGKLSLQKLKSVHQSFTPQELVLILGPAKGLSRKLHVFLLEGGELSNKGYQMCLAVHYLNEKLTKLKSISDVQTFLRNNLGELNLVKTMIFKTGLGNICFRGNLNDIIYITSGGKSIFGGTFATLANVVEVFDQFVCQSKDRSKPNLLVYAENTSALSVHETFGQTSSSTSKYLPMLFRKKREMDSHDILRKSSDRFSTSGYIRLTPSFDKSKWSAKVFGHEVCDESCEKLHLLPSVLFQEDFFHKNKHKSWILEVYDKTLCFKIAKQAK